MRVQADRYFSVKNHISTAQSTLKTSTVYVSTVMLQFNMALMGQIAALSYQSVPSTSAGLSKESISTSTGLSNQLTSTSTGLYRVNIYLQTPILNSVYQACLSINAMVSTLEEADGICFG